MSIETEIVQKTCNRCGHLARGTPMPRHKLLCGDSTSAADVARLFGDEKAALCATDPPYLVDYTGGTMPTSKDWSDVYREVDIKDTDGFFRKVFTNILAVLAPNAAIYCWHAHKRVTDIILVWRALGILDHQQIIWVKPTPVFGRVFWHFQHEPCLMGWRQGSIPKHDGDQTIASVWDVDWEGEKSVRVQLTKLLEAWKKSGSVWSVDWEGKARIIGNEHPTQKPLELFRRPVRKHTSEGDICFEPFGGSGSGLIATAIERRRCFAIELEPVFCDVIRKRWTKYAESAQLNPGSGALR